MTSSRRLTRLKSHQSSPTSTGARSSLSVSPTSKNDLEQTALDTLRNAPDLLGTYRRRMKRHKNSFLGLNANYALVENGVAANLDEAQGVNQMLLRKGHFIQADSTSTTFEPRKIYKFKVLQFNHHDAGSSQHMGGSTRSQHNIEQSLVALEDSMVLLDDKITNQVLHYQMLILAFLVTLVLGFVVHMALSEQLATASMFVTGLVSGLVLGWMILQQYPSILNESVNGLMDADRVHNIVKRQHQRAKSSLQSSALLSGHAPNRESVKDRPKSSTPKRALPAELFNGVWTIDKDRSEDGDAFLKALHAPYLMRRAMAKSSETKKIDYDAARLLWTETKSLGILTKTLEYYLDEREEVKDVRGHGQATVRSRIEDESFITEYDYASGAKQVSKRTVVDADCHVSESTLTLKDGTELKLVKYFNRVES